MRYALASIYTVIDICALEQSEIMEFLFFSRLRVVSRNTVCEEVRL